MTVNYYKYEQDGKVAVLYSPEFGAGWSTWAGDGEKEALTFDADIVKAIINHDFQAAKEIAKKKYPKMYLGGLGDLEIAWLEKGTVFEIEEYDGSESIHVIGSREYMTA